MSVSCRSMHISSTNCHVQIADLQATNTCGSVSLFTLSTLSQFRRHDPGALPHRQDSCQLRLACENHHLRSGNTSLDHVDSMLNAPEAFAGDRSLHEWFELATLLCLQDEASPNRHSDVRLGEEYAHRLNCILSVIDTSS